MKCKKCDGTGYYHAYGIFDDIQCSVKHKCELCNGTGIIKQTNEEWFDELSTEEKAVVLAQFEMQTKLKGNHDCIGCIYDCKIKCMPDIVKNWKEWLEQPH